MELQTRIPKCWVYGVYSIQYIAPYIHFYTYKQPIFHTRFQSWWVFQNHLYPANDVKVLKCPSKFSPVNIKILWFLKLLMFVLSGNQTWHPGKSPWNVSWFSQIKAIHASSNRADFPLKNTLKHGFYRWFSIDMFDEWRVSSWNTSSWSHLLLLLPFLP